MHELRDAPERAEEGPSGDIREKAHDAARWCADDLTGVQDAAVRQRRGPEQSKGESDGHGDGRAEDRDLDRFQRRLDQEPEEFRAEVRREGSGKEPEEIRPRPGIEEDAGVHLGKAGTPQEHEKEPAEEQPVERALTFAERGGRSR